MPAPVLQFKRGNAGVAGTVPALRPGEPAISLNNFDFFIGIDTSVANNKFFGSHRYWGREDGTNSLNLKLVDKDGTNYVAIKAPNTLGGNVTYTLPGTQGINGTVLTNDGSGNLTWGSGSSNAVFSGISTFSDTTDNILGNPDTGAVQIDGGLGVNKNVTVGAGLSVVGTSRFAGDVTFASAAYFGDGDKLYFGDGNDLEIFHNGENSFIKDTGTGTLNILASGFSVLNAGANETLANFNPDGSVELYYDNVKKFETTGVGATITGSLGVSGDLNVAGESYFIGTATFYGGQINLGDSDGDNISVAGEFVSNLVPNATNTYDLGLTGKRWRDGYFSRNLNVTGNLVVDGTATIGGGTTVILYGQDVFIRNKDIILGYTTSVTGDDAATDDTANHAGVAIASTVGSPLVSFVASGINTLPDTYKQLMWFKQGTLGFSTDTFAFNYGVAIGTTNMANGVRLAVGSGVTVGDTSVTAANFFGSLTGNVTGNASSADQVKTVTASDNNATYHITFVDSNNGSATNETVYTDDGIYYNPGANKLTTQHAEFTGNVLVSGITTLTGNVTVSGTLTGTATTATRATLVDTTGTSTNADYFVTFVDTLAGQTSETLRVGAGLSINPSNGDVKTTGKLSVGDPAALTSYIRAGGGSDAMYLYANGDVSFQQKVIVGGLRSSSNSNNTLILSDLDATFARNLLITGITTIGTGVGVTQFSSSVSTGTSTSSVPTSKAVIDYVGTQMSSMDLTLGLNADAGGPSTVNTSQTLTISGTASEVNTSVSGQTVTIGLPDDVVVGTSLSSPTIKTSTIQSSNTGATAITITANDVTIADDLTVSGNLYVNGSTTQVNTAAITVEDRTIELGVVDGSAPSTTTTWDLGVLFNYYDGSAKKSAVVWEQGDQRFKLAGVLAADSNGTNNSTPQLTVTTFAPIEVSELWINNSCTGGASQVIACSGSQLVLQNITVDAGTF